MGGSFQNKIKKSGSGEDSSEVTILRDGRKIKMWLRPDMFLDFSHLHFLSNFVNHLDLEYLRVGGYMERDKLFAEICKGRRENLSENRASLGVIEILSRYNSLIYRRIFKFYRGRHGIVRVILWLTWRGEW